MGAPPTFATRSLTWPIVELVAGLEHPLLLDPLPVDERSVGTAQVLDQEQPLLPEELAVPPADPRGLDPEPAVVVAADRRDAVAEPDRPRGGTASDDQELVVHGSEDLRETAPVGVATVMWMKIP